MGKKVLVLGSLGMAGHVMYTTLKASGGYEVLGVARQQGQFVDEVLDVTDFERLGSYIKKVKPDYIINCVGVLVSQAQQHITTAILLNSYLPHFLAELGNQEGYKLIHISTDCVFSGKIGGYHEDSFRDGDDNYARSKALGEVTYGCHLTIRTSIIGPEVKKNGTGLMDWFLKQEDEIKGYTRAYWSGVTTLELAKATQAAIKQNISGLYHLCPKEKISKFDLLQKIAAVWGSCISIVPDELYKVDKSLICTRKDLRYDVASYDAMLLETKAWMDSNPSFYIHYQK